MAKKTSKPAEVKAADAVAVPAVLLPIVERMRKAEAEDAAAENDEARGCGIEWAKQYATPRELGRLEQRVAELGEAHRDSVATAFVCILNGTRADWDDAREFFNTHVGEGRQGEWEGDGFVRAFAAGALAMWVEVKSYVSAA